MFKGKFFNKKKVNLKKLRYFVSTSLKPCCCPVQNIEINREREIEKESQGERERERETKRVRMREREKWKGEKFWE